MTDKQVGGDHYAKLNVQPWDLMESAFKDSFPDYLLMNAIKYLVRDKIDKYEDVQKAMHYLEKWLTVNPPPPEQAPVKRGRGRPRKS